MADRYTFGKIWEFDGGFVTLRSKKLPYLMALAFSRIPSADVDSILGLTVFAT